MNYTNLIEAAFEAQKKAYTPYSHFQVGAALLCSDGTIYQGCNIENASYGVSNCAERTALFKAVYDGYRDFTAIAVVGKHEQASSFGLCSPCGICRQALREFCDPENFEVVLAKSPEDYQVFKFKEIFPLGFSGKDMDPGA